MQVRDTLEILGALAFVLTVVYGLFDLRVNLVRKRQGTAPSRGMLVSVRTLVFGVLTVLFFVAALIAVWAIGG